MSDLIERFANEVRQRPLLTLAVTGVVGAVVVSRLRADDDDRLAELAEGGRRGADALGSRVADLADLAGKGVATGAAAIARQVERSGDVSDRIVRGVEDAGRESGDALRAGAAAVDARTAPAIDALDDFSLQDLVRRLVDERFGPSRVERVRRAAASVGITEKSVAVFAATLLAKSTSGYLRWRGEQQARLQAEALADDSGEDFEARLEDRTVVELRQLAAERELEGRSSMNKDELVAALGGDH